MGCAGRRKDRSLRTVAFRAESACADCAHYRVFLANEFNEIWLSRINGLRTKTEIGLLGKRET